MKHTNAEQIGWKATSKTGIVALLYQTNTQGKILIHNVKGNLLTHFVVPQHLYT